MRKTNWLAISLIVLSVIVLLLAGATLLVGWRQFGWGMMDGWWMMRPGFMGPGMMGRGNFAPVSWLYIVLSWLTRLGVLALIALGVVWLALAVSGASRATPPTRLCPSCGRALLEDWRHCPYCGAKPGGDQT